MTWFITGYFRILLLPNTTILQFTFIWSFSSINNSFFICLSRFASLSLSHSQFLCVECLFIVAVSMESLDFQNECLTLHKNIVKNNGSIVPIFVSNLKFKYSNAWHSTTFIDLWNVQTH